MKWSDVQVLLWIFFSTSLAVSSWRPVDPAQLGSGILHQEAAIYGNSPYTDENTLTKANLYAHAENDQCALYKVAMRQQLYFEYVQYKMDFPDMKEFTLCMWTKFNNHTNDHPLFSYAVGDQPRGVLSWIANTARSSYYMLNIDGHTLYRLNYPLRLNKWYHSCQSWNGHTGEWQIWVNDERVGRGFNNRLVGHVIKGGGIAITGQEQRQLAGGFLEGEGAPPGSGGMLGEVTMVQLYGIALTAGKAHRDHKHHHAHHYEHDTNNNIPPSTTPQAPVTGPSLPMNPYLTGGQINHQVKINPGAHVQIVQNGVTLRHPSIPTAQAPLPQPFPPANPIPVSTPSPASNLISRYPSILNTYRPTQYFGTNTPQFSSLPSPINPINGYSFVDRRYRNVAGQKMLSKRENAGEAEPAKNLPIKKDDKVSFVAEKTEPIFGQKNLTKRDSDTKTKRALLQLSDGSIFDDSFIVQQNLDNDYFSGLANFGVQLKKAPESKAEEREPAEGEVKQVMDVCDGCADEPFERALIMGWRTVAKKLYSGALHIPAVPMCKAF
ncbi:uncharacterized protein LOC117176830 [Belonocnema kinseyi]|uniref:uncharacterized protein LOC117176830 n=1 Tax=Belonocnema kinseyi TaxID=2817044 RepID=UPI00143D2F96|nr:uncharacterized protein LOC117176830 [Belonocnema kinseyi]